MQIFMVFKSNLGFHMVLNMMHFHQKCKPNRKIDFSSIFLRGRHDLKYLGVTNRCSAEISPSPGHFDAILIIQQFQQSHYSIILQFNN